MSAIAAALRAALPFGIAFGAVIWLATAPLEALAGPEAQLLERVNRVRAQHKLIELAPSQDLARVARAHAEDMARRSYLSHVNPEGQNPLQRAQGAGLSGFRLFAENIGATSVAGDPVQIIVDEMDALPRPPRERAEPRVQHERGRRGRDPPPARRSSSSSTRPIHAEPPCADRLRARRRSDGSGDPRTGSPCPDRRSRSAPPGSRALAADARLRATRASGS